MFIYQMSAMSLSKQQLMKDNSNYTPGLKGKIPWASTHGTTGTQGMLRGKMVNCDTCNCNACNYHPPMDQVTFGMLGVVVLEN